MDICHTEFFVLARAKLKQRFSLSSIPSCRYRTAASLNFLPTPFPWLFVLWPLHDPSFGLTSCVKKGSTLSTSVFLTRLEVLAISQAFISSGGGGAPILGVLAGLLREVRADLLQEVRADLLQEVRADLLQEVREVMWDSGQTQNSCS